MTHDEVERGSVVDRYVSGDLPPADAHAFEAHLFACDACFDAVQATERLRGAVRDAAAGGLLDVDDAAATAAPAWFAPAFALSAAAAVVLAVVTAWLAAGVIPRLRGELTTERSARIAAERNEQTHRADLQGERERRTALEAQVAAAEPNVPVVIVQAERAGAGAVPVAVPAGARHVLLWIESAPSRYASFALVVARADGATVETVGALAPNAQGALSVALPAAALADGSYLARLYETSTAERTLVAEYRLNITRSAH